MWEKAKEGTKRGKLTSWLEFRMCAFVAWAPDHHHQRSFYHHHHQNNLRNKYHNSDLDSFQMTSPMVLQLAMTRGSAVCVAPLSETICTLCIGVALNTGLFTNFVRRVGNIIMKNNWLDFVLVLVTLDRTGNFLCFVADTLGGSTWFFVLILLDFPWQRGFIPC